VSHSATEAEVVRSTFVAQFIGLMIPTVFGAFIATAAFDEFSFVTGLVAGSPDWLIVPLLLIGLIGSLGQGSINLYSMGLDMDAILPKLSRVKSTVIVAAFATSLVFVGKFVYDAATAVTNSVLFLTCLATSWTAISLYGYLKIRGNFNKADLQVFNSQRTGGIYWFGNGWNMKAVIAWGAGSTSGILAISSVDYVGPIANLFQGIDLSIPASAVVALSVYLIAESWDRTT
jgi:purine-cytosine permease-like protein